MGTRHKQTTRKATGTKPVARPSKPQSQPSPRTRVPAPPAPPPPVPPKPAPPPPPPPKPVRTRVCRICKHYDAGELARRGGLCRIRSPFVPVMPKDWCSELEA